jgi:hypothetical protein
MAEGGDGAQGQSGAAQQADGRQPSGGESGGERAGASGQTAQPGPGTRPAQPEAGKPGDSSTPTGSGGWAGGDRPDRQDRPLAEGSSQTKEMEWGEQDLANARNAANLAVEHLRKAVEAGRTDVLDQLGWTRDQARAFLERWEKMQHFAESGDPARRGEFDRAVRSLGLRPDGVRTARDVPADVKGGQAEGRRSRPPSDYREQFKAYTQGTAGE